MLRESNTKRIKGLFTRVWVACHKMIRNSLEAWNKSQGGTATSSESEGVKGGRGFWNLEAETAV